MKTKSAIALSPTGAPVVHNPDTLRWFADHDIDNRKNSQIPWRRFDDKSVLLGKGYVEIDFRNKFMVGADKLWLMLSIRNGSFISLWSPLGAVLEQINECMLCFSTISNVPE